MKILRETRKNELTSTIPSFLRNFFTELCYNVILCISVISWSFIPLHSTIAVIEIIILLALLNTVTYGNSKLISIQNSLQGFS